MPRPVLPDELYLSQGVVAKDDDLVAAFGTNDRDTCCRAILKKGKLQVSDKERDAVFES